MIEKLKEIKLFADDLYCGDDSMDGEKIAAMELFIATTKMINVLNKRILECPAYYFTGRNPVTAGIINLRASEE